MPSMTPSRWQRIHSGHGRRGDGRLPRWLGLEELEARTLLSISPTIIAAGSEETSTARGTAGETTTEILDPAPFAWTYVSSPQPHYVGVLEYGEATFHINGQTLTTRAYRQAGGDYSIPARR